ncbi:MAG: hypothetical protein IH614_08710 [Desulfuromonadales bacterium]|nr:hypothetical protein [Desulfuromonadales bacterium]
MKVIPIQNESINILCVAKYAKEPAIVDKSNTVRIQDGTMGMMKTFLLTPGRRGDAPAAGRFDEISLTNYLFFSEVSIVIFSDALTGKLEVGGVVHRDRTGVTKSF